MSAPILTIGHSTHSSAKLIELLRAHQVTAIADVRSRPYSRMNPQFNREALKSALKTNRIAYVFLGLELGARAEDQDCYEDGKVQYDRLAKTALFQEGLARVEKGSARYRIALLCAERDPLVCHRAILVCRHLAERGLQVAHILANSRLESHEDALNRLLRETGVGDRELFRSKHDLINEAYEKRGEAIAYSEKSSAPNASLLGPHTP